ncbi:IQ domain-containing protein N [Mauremys reevesii]|uniref:IQ domain-containing protein N n=1 Tax=Mauremys reevesii TaxID=260615 RepID=UPI00193F61AA|nr:IQ domain-containing protein N [Mauremys reevesii]
MEAVEQYPSAPRPWHGRVQLSFEELTPAGRQRPRSRLSPGRRHSRHRASSFDEVLVDEWDMLLDAAAAIIQAAWRGYQARQQLRAQYHAAVAIQAAWRGFLARERLASQRVEATAWQGYPAGRGHGWAEPELEEEQAAVVIQAHYRGYRVRCEIHNQYLAATIIQAHYRGYRARQALAESHRAATTIQAHWRGYRTRQELAPARAALRPTSSLRDFFSRTYRGLVNYMMGAQEAPPPPPTRLPSRTQGLGGAQAPLGFPARWPGECRAGREKLPGLAQRGDTASLDFKKCPQCGRNMRVWVLEGVGKGTACQSDASSEGRYYHTQGPPWQAAPGHPGARREGTGYSAVAERACHGAGHGRAQARQAGARRTERAEQVHYKGHRHWTGTPPASKMVAEERAAPKVWQQGREKGQEGRPCVARAATRGRERGRRSTADLSAMRYHSSASFLPSAERQQDAEGTAAAWLSSSFWTSQPEGERRVFKTRKRYWRLVQAATRIQAFWRGCQARRALREQKAAAVRIQSAFRGYQTRAYLSAVGVLSGGETEEESDSAWSCRSVRCH